jgi:hypothetical protein
MRNFLYLLGITNNTFIEIFGGISEGLGGRGAFHLHKFQISVKKQKFLQRVSREFYPIFMGHSNNSLFLILCYPINNASFGQIADIPCFGLYNRQYSRLKKKHFHSRYFDMLFLIDVNKRDFEYEQKGIDRIHLSAEQIRKAGIS